MDQTPVYHAMNARATIEHVGTKTVNMRTSTADSKRVTVAATITASGKILPTMVVFKVSHQMRLKTSRFLLTDMLIVIV